MLQNKSMPISGECQSDIFSFAILYNEFFLSEEDRNKETFDMIREMEVTEAMALLAEIWDEKSHS